MNRTVLSGLALAALTCGAALAQSFNDQVVSTMTDQGFQVTEIKSGPTQTKVEAVKGTTKLEVVYDRATGQILKQETERFTGDGTSAVEISNSGRDFADAGRGHDVDDDDSGSGASGNSHSDDDHADSHDDDHDKDHDKDHDNDDDDGHDDDSNSGKGSGKD